MVNPVLYSPVAGPLRSFLSAKAANIPLRSWMKRNLGKSDRFNAVMTRMLGRKVPAAAAEAMRKPLARLIGHEDTVRRLLRESFTVDQESIQGLQMPVLVLWGGADRLMGGSIPQKMTQKDGLSAEYHLLKGAGHCAMLTHSHAVNDFLRGWIKSMWK